MYVTPDQFSRFAVLATRLEAFICVIVYVCEIYNTGYKVVVVGGGAGGCSTAAKLSSKLGKGNVAVIEPNSMHYYQPMWTLVGGGMKTLEASGRPMADVLPKKADWIKQKVTDFDPQNNKVTTEDGQDIHYEYLVVALGIQLNYNVVSGKTFSKLSLTYFYALLLAFLKQNSYEVQNKFKKANSVLSFSTSTMTSLEKAIRISGLLDTDTYLSTFIFNHGLGVALSIVRRPKQLWHYFKDRDLKIIVADNNIDVNENASEAMKVRRTLMVTESARMAKNELPQARKNVFPTTYLPGMARATLNGEGGGFGPLHKLFDHLTNFLTNF
ncbi:unnamed protein product, partial [Meganyctiphanes norvegica]